MSVNFRIGCLLLALAVGCTYTASILTSSAESDWVLWKRKYNKFYGTAEEENTRKATWMDHYEVYRKHTENADRQYKMEMNRFADQILRRSHASVFGRENEMTNESRRLGFAPDSWDWRTRGAITPVKGQGQFGDSSAIVATECVDSYMVIKEGLLVSVSQWEVHDCCTNDPSAPLDVFTCIHNIGGLCSDSSYPASRGSCRNDSCSPAAQLNGGKQSPRGDESALVESVYSMPVMAGIDASHPSFQLYRSGVYTDPACSTTRLDHAVQIVGYGSQSGRDYWIIKNSWGSNWGMDGYMWLARNHGNMCGIATAAYYPV